MNTVPRVFAYLRRYPWLALGTLCCAIVGTAMVLVFPAVNEEGDRRGAHPAASGAVGAANPDGGAGVFAPARAQAKLPITFFLVPTMQEFHSALTELAVSA